MTVTNDQLTTYRDEGWCLVRQLIPVAVVEAVRDRVADIVGNPPPWPAGRFQYLDPALYTRPGGGLMPGALQRPALEDDTFAAMARHPQLEAAMAELLGGPVTLFTDQVGIKHGFVTEDQGGRTYYHQDSFYWHIAPHLGCNCWMPLHAVGRDAICLAVIPGSHRGWELVPHESYYDAPAWGSARTGDFVAFKRHRLPLDTPHPTAEKLLPMEPGDALFFTNYTWHRSEPNRTGSTLAFYAVAHQLATST